MVLCNDEKDMPDWVRTHAKYTAYYTMIHPGDVRSVQIVSENGPRVNELDHKSLHEKKRHGNAAFSNDALPCLILTRYFSIR
ncbi:hypothetical protein KSF_022730 [Reticulibacter mediterranei]|uniref:Uncharacterized protein n=1 Tax=Reticulibacter mediterranei TaxID=2778369 RepID=A0A8J3IGX6_9CHLR|nr:hypothetical protein KSF_022730 [Reticulibacter mediterranei]